MTSPRRPQRDFLLSRFRVDCVFGTSELHADVGPGDIRLHDLPEFRTSSGDQDPWFFGGLSGFGGFVIFGFSGFLGFFVCFGFFAIATSFPFAPAVLPDVMSLGKLNLVAVRSPYGIGGAIAGGRRLVTGGRL